MPPLTGVAVKVILAPGQIGFAEATIDTLAVVCKVTVVAVEDVAVAAVHPLALV